MDGGMVTFDNLPQLLPIAVFPGEKKLSFLRRIQSALGLSESKSLPPRYDLKKHDIAYPITNLKTD